ncbi:hypothetical protein GWK47_029565 [Chionoecetes opilio]|uniref:Uncharacterized protein n=1 Tax=Chionoecetes opilio TaxID=41210 RepID=A0A8J4YWE6_CHIOP|nr:hypothetical protein GWK47_029565 [Chionoecetes opilio]
MANAGGGRPQIGRQGVAVFAAPVGYGFETGLKTGSGQGPVLIERSSRDRSKVACRHHVSSSSPRKGPRGLSQHPTSRAANPLSKDFPGQVGLIDQDQHEIMPQTTPRRPSGTPGTTPMRDSSSPVAVQPRDAIAVRSSRHRARRERPQGFDSGGLGSPSSALKKAKLISL